MSSAQQPAQQIGFNGGSDLEFSISDTSPIDAFRAEVAQLIEQARPDQWEAILGALKSILEQVSVSHE